MATKHALQVLLETMSDHDEDYSVRSYSGRGMYGQECLSVTFSGNVGKFFADVLVRCGVDGEIDDTIPEAFEKMAQDSMGKEKVVYFPNVEYVSADTDEDDLGDTDAL